MAPYGFVVDDAELEPPEPGSMEATFAAAGIGLSVVDLRPARSTGALAASWAPQPDRVPMDSGYIYAFGAMVHVPRSTVAGDLGS
ncbi:MAG: hypothetical protein ACRDHM_10240 [Actinomycetota bacterium]